MIFLLKPGTDTESINLSPIFASLHFVRRAFFFNEEESENKRIKIKLPVNQSVQPPGPWLWYHTYIVIGEKTETINDPSDTENTKSDKDDEPKEEDFDNVEDMLWAEVI